MYEKIDHWVQRSSLCRANCLKPGENFNNGLFRSRYPYIFVPQNMYHITKDMHRHSKTGSILINKKQKKVNNRSFFNSALRTSLGSVACRKGPRLSKKSFVGFHMARPLATSSLAAKQGSPRSPSLQRALPHKQWDNQCSNQTCGTLARIGHVYLHSHTESEKTEIGVKQRRTNVDGILPSSCTASQASMHFSDVLETNSQGTLVPKRICRAK